MGAHVRARASRSRRVCGPTRSSFRGRSKRQRLTLPGIVPTWSHKTWRELYIVTRLPLHLASCTASERIESFPSRRWWKLGWWVVGVVETTTAILQYTVAIAIYPTRKEVLQYCQYCNIAIPGSTDAGNQRFGDDWWLMRPLREGGGLTYGVHGVLLLLLGVY